jgi:hypothetical protein
MGDTPAEFRRRIVDERIVRFFDYWQQIRGQRLMPAWEHIRPEEIAPLLPNVWAWRIDPDGQPHLRLAGEGIAQSFTATKGKTLFDLYPQDYAQRILAEFTRVVREPACSHVIGRLEEADMPVGSGERLALPYGAEERDTLGIIGISYHQRKGPIYTTRSSFSKLIGETQFLDLGTAERT